MKDEIRTDAQRYIELRRECIVKILNCSYPLIDNHGSYMPLPRSFSKDIVKHADALFKYIKNGQ